MFNPVRRKFNRENFIVVNEALKAVAPFPFFGTLLGLTRDGDIIRNDDDVDFYVNVRFREAVIELVRGAGFDVQMGAFPNETKFFLQATRVIDGVNTYVDFYLYENFEDLPWIIDRWNFGARPSDEGLHIFVEKELLFPLVKKKFFGIDVFFPINPEGCCEFIYGSNWKAKLSKHKGDYKVIIHDHKPVVARKGDIIFSLLSQKQSNEAEIAELRAKLNSCATEREALAAQVDEIAIERQRLLDECSQLTAERDSYSGQLQDAINQRDVALAQLSDRSGGLSQLGAQYAVEREERQRLAAQCEQLASERDQLASRCERLAGESLDRLKALPDGLGRPDLDGAASAPQADELPPGSGHAGEEAEAAVAKRESDS
ncbi:hypothetical protein [Methylocystis sp. S23]